MNPLLEQLHDIEGIDPISWWPLAIGWWILISLGILIASLLIAYAVYWITFRRSWKSDTLHKLDYLENHLADTTAREIVISLSEYIRRIAIRRYSRKACAGLTGEAWLKWLSEHDPKGFDWENKAPVLLDVPYAPLNASLSTEKIKELIVAIRSWVR